MSDDIVDRLTIHHPTKGSTLRRAADEIVRLRERVTELEAENLRVRRYAEEMDALAERRLMSTNAERALADQLAEALHDGTPAADCWCSEMVSGRCLGCRSRAALAAYDRARNPETDA